MTPITPRVRTEILVIAEIGKLCEQIFLNTTCMMIQAAGGPPAGENVTTKY